MYDVIIIGGGPAGLTAAIYASRADLKTLLIEHGILGGQVMQTYEVDNYPGFPNISGAELVMKMQEHAEAYEVEFKYEDVTELQLDGEVKCVITDDGEYEGRTVLYAAGAQPRKLMVPGEEEFRGHGVSYCATCDGAFFRGKTVAVIGGGDTAAEDAMYLARFCKKVYIVIRRDMMRAAGSLQRHITEQENIEIIRGCRVKEISGDEVVTGITLNSADGDEIKLDVDGVFSAIGVEPESQLIKNQVDVDEAGYIECNSYMMTSVPGVFAAGDVRKKELRQILTAASDGAVAITGILEYLSV